MHAFHAFILVHTSSRGGSVGRGVRSVCPTIRSTSLSLAIIHDHPRIRTRVNAIERYSSVSERITHAIVADGGWRATVLVCVIRSDIRYERDPVPPRAVARIPAHAENNVRSPRFLLRRPRRRLQGDQGPSTFFRRSSRRERRANGATRAPSSREGTTARKCASVAGDRRTTSIGASRRARERERGDRRGRWVRGKRYARAFTARTRRGAAWTRARAPAHGRGRRYAHPRARDGDLLVDCVWEGGVC